MIQLTTATDKPTDRQLELLAHLCSGLSIAEGAKKQFIAERTAYNVMAAIRKKVGAGSNEQLVVIAFQEEWLALDDDGKVTVAAEFSL